MPGDSAIMVPHTDDGRVLFAIPWLNRLLVGTTDTLVPEILLEPRPLSEEIEFLLKHAARYLTKDPTPSDVLSIFAGLRPLVNTGSEDNTSEISRDHTLHISGSAGRPGHLGWSIHGRSSSYSLCRNKAYSNRPFGRYHGPRPADGPDNRPVRLYY